MPPRFMHGRTKQAMPTSLDQTMLITHQQRAAPQQLPSVTPQPPQWVPPGSGDVGAPQISPIGMPYTAATADHSGWSPGDNNFDGLIFRDRHPVFQHGTELAGRISSRPDPPMDGPARADMRLINRTWNWQVGTGAAYTDDLTRPYTWLGTQDGTWSAINGGQPGFFRWGPGGPPSTMDAPGPGRVDSGPAHGLHTMYPADRMQTLQRFQVTAQTRPARVDRLSNSRIAGQNYSQTTLHQGAAPGSAPPGARFRGGPR
jgi:hypothetical protein